MAERSEWAQLREQRMAEPGAHEAYQAARLASSSAVSSGSYVSSVAGARLSWRVRLV
nr:hypothetical protein [Frankia sp. CiP3]